MDDSEFYLVHDKSKDRWMFTLCQDWIETSARKDCERCSLSFKDCTYAYLDIDRGLRVFKEFLTAIKTGDFSEMISCKDLYERSLEDMVLTYESRFKHKRKDK